MQPTQPHSTQTISSYQIANNFKVIACIDMDAFYAGAEAARYGYDETVPVVVIQYEYTIAVSYAARKYEIKRPSKYEDIKHLSPDIVFIHVDTIRIGEPYVDPYQRDLNAKLTLSLVCILIHIKCGK